MDEGFSVHEFKDLCRFCLQFASEQNPQFPLFLHHGHYGRYSKNSNESLPEIITSCLGMKIDPDDGLPLNVCNSCEESLISSNAFRVKCFRSQETLLSIKECHDKTISQLEPDYEIDENIPLKRMSDVSNEQIKAEDVPMQEDFVEYNEVPEEQENDDDSNDEDYAPAADEDPEEEEEDDDAISDQRYEVLHIEKLSETPSAAPKPMKYGSIKRPLKSIPKSEIATPSSSRNTDIDSSFDPAQSADESGAQETDGNTTGGGAKKRIRSHLPKQCYVCGLIVTRMRDHMKSHPGELQYKCEHCPRSYLTKTGRDRHMDGQHPETRLDPTIGINCNTQPYDAPPVKRSYAQSHLWERNIKKARRAAGLDYVGQNGQPKPARRVREPCPLACPIECRQNFSESERHRINAHYWSLSAEDKVHFLLVHVVRMYPERRRLSDGVESSRVKQFSYKYHFELNGTGKKLQVCRKFFSHTLDLNRNQLYRIFDGKQIQPVTKPQEKRKYNKKNRVNVADEC